MLLLVKRKIVKKKYRLFTKMYSNISNKSKINGYHDELDL